MTSAVRCPCGSGDTYAECCERFHLGPATAPTAAALMRSRFSAFALSDKGYLLRTWHPSTRPADLDLDADTHWMRLDVVRTVAGGLFDHDGTVEFRAHYRVGGSRGVMHERSRFVRTDGQWFYVDGDVTH